ncbi:type VII secretion protein EccB [Mycolicibacillus trivialis]
MPTDRVTPLQLNAHRYRLRRLDSALRTGTARGVAPRRPLTAGAVVAALIGVAAVVLAVLHPRPGVGEAGLVVGRDTGALYVRVGSTWHPVLNLASARLIAGAPAGPRPVPEAALAGLTGGPLLGIPGAPQTLGEPLAEPNWTVCDTTEAAAPGERRTGVAVGGAEPPGPPIPDGLVVTTGGGAPRFLLRDGRRSRLPDRGPPVDGAVRTVSALLLNTVPEESAVAAPQPGPATSPATLCVTWQAGAITVSGGERPSLPDRGQPVPLAQADGPGPALDAVWLPPGRSGYVRCSGAGGTGYLITETGVRFPVADAAAAGDLGLPAEPAAAPCPLLTALPVGPVLSREAAATAHDAVVSPPR